MSAGSRQAHWEGVYTAKAEHEVSWFQDSPEPSLALIKQADAGRRSAIIDIGGGASRLVDTLIGLDYADLTVLDLSAAALAVAQARLGRLAEKVSWIVADITAWEPPRRYDLWHDRAAFHFLTEERERQAYVARLMQALRPGGHAIIATFASDGPERCSGLPVMRYDAASLSETLGSAFVLLNMQRHEHGTPWGTRQRFQFSTCRRSM
jgi:SAM-dependent methyltransferase